MLAYEEHQSRLGTEPGTLAATTVRGVHGFGEELRGARILLTSPPLSCRVPKGAIHTRTDDKGEIKEPLYR